MGFRVPDDVAVVGRGDIDVSAYVTPSLTTMVIAARGDCSGCDGSDAGTTSGAG